MQKLVKPAPSSSTSIEMDGQLAVHRGPVLDRLTPPERQESLRAPLRSPECYDQQDGKSIHSDGLPMIQDVPESPLSPDHDATGGTDEKPHTRRHTASGRTHARNVSWESASSLVSAGLLLDEQGRSSAEPFFTKPSR